jgi:FkbM family methyltransferase
LAPTPACSPTWAPCTRHTPRLAELIERNIARNGWQNRAEVRREGASAAAGTMTLYLVATDSESTLEAGRARQRQVQDEVATPVVALDDVLEAEGFVVADTLLKIDVEGHEMRVLDGLERTLRRQGPRPTLIIEFLGKAIAEDGAIERVLALGLDVYYVASDSLVRIGSTADLARSHRLDLWNFLLTDRPIDVVRRATAAAGIRLTDIS